jgi:hypothetical protein
MDIRLLHPKEIPAQSPDGADAKLCAGAENKCKTAIYPRITDTERKLFTLIFGSIVDEILSEPD